MHAQLDEVQRLAKLVDGLTLLTKADAGELTLEREPATLDEMAAECFEDTLIMAHSQRIQVEMPACDKAMIRGNRHRLRQVMLNLADNTVKYTHTGSRIIMELRTRAGAAEFEITNTGVGIARDLQPHIFDRFIRGNEARSMTVEGCGLGLTICQWIVREHGGTIKVRSVLGQTTTFTVNLPLTEQSDPPSG